MKTWPILSAALFALVVVPCSLRADSLYSVVTDPVGFTKVTLAAATGSTTTQQALAIPYNRPGVYWNAVSSVSTNTLVCANAGWAVSQFTTVPHFVKIKRGTNAGRYFLISSHTSDTLTVSNGGVALTGVVNAADAFEIFPANTLSSFFGAPVALQSGATVAAADEVRLNLSSQWTSFFYNGTHWNRADLQGGFQDSYVILPEQALFIIHKGLSPVTLTLSGSVSSGTERSTIPGSGDSLLSNRFPIATTLGSLNFQAASGWKSGVSASVADDLLIWGGTGWKFYYYNGNSWQQTGTFSGADSTVISPTTPIFVRRNSAATGPAVYLPQSAPFVNQ